MGPDDSVQRTGSTVGRSTVRPSVLLVVAAVFVSLTAGTVGGAAVGSATASGAATGADAAPVTTPTVVDSGQARQVQDSNVDICGRDASTFVRVYNAQTDSVPGFVASRVKDSNVHLQVEDDADENYTMVANETGQIIRYSEGKPESASLRVETDCATFIEITDSQRPSETFQQAYLDGRVRLVGLDPVNFVFFEGLNRVTDPIAWAVLLGLFLLAVVVLYLFYRRLTLYYRDDEDETDGPPPDGAAGSPPNGGPNTGGPRDVDTRSGGEPGQGQGQRQGQPPGQGQGPGPDPRSGGEREPRSGGEREPRSGDGPESRPTDSRGGGDRDSHSGGASDASSTNRDGNGNGDG